MDLFYLDLPLMSHLIRKTLLGRRGEMEILFLVFKHLKILSIYLFVASWVIAVFGISFHLPEIFDVVVRCMVNGFIF